MELTYTAVGATEVGQPTWTTRPAGFRAYERSVPLGSGPQVWRDASEAVLQWGVKTRSGFTVEPLEGDLTAREGADYTLVARVGPLSVHEPVRVVSVVRDARRCGFAYGTCEGHPVTGEEAFVVWRDGEEVWLTLRSLTRPSTGGWRLVFPLLLLAQRWYRLRYLRALRAS